MVGSRNLRIAAAEDQLLRLGEEFDLADAAASELDIVAGDRDARVPAMAVNLALDGVDVLDGGVVQALAPDEGLHVLQEQRARVGIAGALTRLDPGRALPILAHALVVKLGGHRRNRDLGCPRIGPQAQIDAKDVAIRGRLGEKLDEALHQVDRGGALFAAAREGKAVLVVEDDKIDVARIIELETAHLAHGQNDEPGALLQRLGRKVGIAGLFRGGCEEKPQRAFHGAIGKARQRAGYGLEIENPGDIGQRDRQRGPPLGDSQPPHRGSEIGFAADRQRFGIERGESGLRSGGQELSEPGAILQHQPRKIGAVARGRADQRSERGKVQRRGERFKLGDGARGARWIEGGCELQRLGKVERHRRELHLRASNEKARGEKPRAFAFGASQVESAARGFLELSGRLEAQALGRLDLDRLAGARIAPHARGALGRDEGAESSNLEPAAALHAFETRCDGIENQFHGALGVRFADLALFRDGLDETCFAHVNPSSVRSGIADL